MKKFLLLVPVLLALSSCNLFSDYGKKVSIGQSEIFYKGNGVTKEDAEKVGNFLLENKLITTTKQSSAQVVKDNNAYIVRLIMDTAKMEPGLRLNMWKLQNDLSKQVFNGSDARFAFTNDKFENQDLLPSVNAHYFGKAAVFYDSKEFKGSSIEDLSEFLQKEGLISGEEDANVMVRKENNQSIIRIVYNKDYYQANEQKVDLIMGYLQYLLENNYPAFKDARIWLITKDYQDFKKIALLSKEEVAQLESSQAAAQTSADTTSVPREATAPASQQ